jgi:serine/threonine protein kinase
MAPEVFDSSQYSFPADVYSFAILYYEIVEGRAGIVPPFAGVYKHATLVGTMGRRPVISKANEFQTALLQEMWQGDPYDRPDFTQIVAMLENKSSWFNGVDEHEFLRYKGYLDVNEPAAADSQVVLPEWLTQASANDAILGRLEDIMDPAEVIIKTLASVTTSNAAQEAAFTAALQRSFATKGCVDRDELLGYVRDHLAALLAKTKKKKQRSPKALTPLTGALTVVAEEFDVDPKQKAAGSFGVVFQGTRKKVESTEPDLTAAIKRISLPFDADLMICSTFREIITLIYCRHPTVIPFIGWNFEIRDGKAEFVVVTEWMQGGALEFRRLPKDNPTMKSICAYGGARGLQVLHERSIIHRDIKPANIFLDTDRRPRIADLGMAKMLVQDTGHTSMMGSPLYMAPEVIQGDQSSLETWSYPADVYAYGITLWGLYAGREWSGAPNIRSIHQLKQRIVAGTLRPERVRDKMNDDVWKLLQRMWHGCPDARPTAREVADLLEQPRFWLSGTDPAKFGEYVTFLETEGSEGRVESIEEWAHLLENSKSANEMAAPLRTGPFKDSVTGRVAQAMGIISGVGGVPDENVITRVKACLDELGYLHPKRLNDPKAVGAPG